MKAKLLKIEYQNNDNFQHYVNKYERLAKQIDPKVKESVVITEMLAILLEKLRKYFADRDPKNKKELLKLYPQFVEYRKRTYDVKKKEIRI